MPTTWNAIFLGNIGIDIDPTENNTTSEDAGALVGMSFGSDADRLASHVVTVTTIDNGGSSGVLDTNNKSSNDQVQYDLGDGSGTQTVQHEGSAIYNATLTYTDGTTANVTAVIFQDENGNLFLAPEFSANADSVAMEAKAIRSLTLGTLVSSRIVRRIFGVTEVLVPAIRLVGLPGIELASDMDWVTWVHVLTDRHDVIFAEGAPTKTLLPGPFALEAIGPAARPELLRLYPRPMTGAPLFQSARLIPPNERQRRSVERHARNRQALAGGDLRAEVVAA